MSPSDLADQCEELRARATREIVCLVPVISEAAGPAESDMLRSFDPQHGGGGVSEWLSFLASGAVMGVLVKIVV